VRLLIFNAGSSSLKFDVVEISGAGPSRSLLAGAFADAGDGEFVLRSAVASQAAPPSARTLAEAADYVWHWLSARSVHGRNLRENLAATVHRIVHGGALFRETTILREAQLAALAELSPLAPLHNPPALAVIAAVRSLAPKLPAIGVFDTAYYADLPPAAFEYAVPARWRREFGIRRYGFHGMAHRSLCQSARTMLPASRPAPRVVSLQLGRGCSVTASRGAHAIATSMGFTPLEGLVMGTRCGDLDAGALLYVMERGGIPATEARRELNEQSGLLGLSGKTGDMRALLALEADGDAAAALALEIFCRRARHYLAAYIAELGGVDAIVFGGGIGENCPEIRRRIVHGLGWAGIELLPKANAACVGAAANVAAPSSRAAILVIPVDEASVIADEAAALLRS